MASGGSTIAIAYDGGVLMAADTLLSYGSMAKSANVPRCKIISSNAAVGFTGDYADFQKATETVRETVAEDEQIDDGIVKTPAELFSLLHRSVYENRCEFTPWQCTFIVIGHANGEGFLGACDSIGTRWSDQCLATGYGGHICVPLMRRALEVAGGKLSRDQALQVLEDCMRTLFYRECRAINRFQVAEAADGKVVLHPPKMVDTNFEFQGFKFETTAIIV